MPRLTQNQLKQYKKNVDDILEVNVYQGLIDTLGPKGKLKNTFSLYNEYNAIEMDIPKGLDEKTVTALIIGAMMDPNNYGMYDYNLTTSNPDVRRPLESNQNFVIDNVSKSDNRTKDFSPAIVEARRRAKEALEAFKNNDPEPAQNLLRHFLNFATTNRADVKFIDTKASYLGSYKNITDNSRAAIALAAELYDVPPLNVTSQNSSIEEAKLKSHRVQTKALDNVIKARHALVHYSNSTSQHIKEERAADIIFDLYISNLNVQMDEKDKAETDKVFYGYIKMITGIDGQSDDPDEQRELSVIMDANKELHYARADMLYAVKANKISNIEAMLATPEGYEKLKNLYKSAIKKTPQYLAILNARTEEDMMNAINDAENMCGEMTIQEKFPNVKIPEAAKQLNDAQRERYSIAVDKTRSVIEDKMAEKVRSVGEDSSILFKDVKPETLLVNANNIAGMLAAVKAVNKRGGSQNFKDMQEALKEFAKFAKKLSVSGKTPTASEMAEYIKLGKEVSKLASHYLDNKTRINSTYAANRVREVELLKVQLTVNIRAAEDLKEECLKNELGDKYDDYKNMLKYSIFHDPETKTAFRGNKYDPTKIIPSSGAGFSTERCAAYSITVMALAATGKYSLDDIMDPSKFRAEKAEMFDTVIHNTTYSTPENNKWIAEKIVNGMEITKKQIDDKLRTLDFSDPKTYESDGFKRISEMEFLRFDIWQEVKHVRDLAFDEAKKINPELKSYDEYSSKIIVETGIISNMNSSAEKFDLEYKELMEKPALKDEDKFRHRVQIIIENALQVELYRRNLKDMMEKGEGRNYSELNDATTSTYVNLAGTQFSEKYIQKFVNVYCNHPELLKQHMEQLKNGEFFKGVTVNIDATKDEPVEMTGIEDLQDRVESEGFLIEAEKATVRLETQKYKSREEFFKDSSLAITGAIYKQSGKLPKKTETGKNTSLTEYAEVQFKSEIFRKSLLSGKEPGKMKNPKSVAATARNPEKIKQIIRRANEKEMNRMKENGPEILKDNTATRNRTKAVTKKIGKK